MGLFLKRELKGGVKAEAVTYYQAAAEGARSSDGEGAKEEHPQDAPAAWHSLA